MPQVYTSCNQKNRSTKTKVDLSPNRVRTCPIRTVDINVSRLISIFDCGPFAFTGNQSLSCVINTSSYSCPMQLSWLTSSDVLRHIMQCGQLSSLLTNFQASSKFKVHLKYINVRMSISYSAETGDWAVAGGRLGRAPMGAWVVRRWAPG